MYKMTYGMMYLLQTHISCSVDEAAADTEAGKCNSCRHPHLPCLRANYMDTLIVVAALQARGIDTIIVYIASGRYSQEEDRSRNADDRCS